MKLDNLLAVLVAGICLIGPTGCGEGIDCTDGEAVFAVWREHLVAIDEAWTEWTMATGHPWWALTGEFEIPVEELWYVDPVTAEVIIGNLRWILKTFESGTGQADAMEDAYKWLCEGECAEQFRQSIG